MNTPLQINSQFTPGKPQKPVRDAMYLRLIRRLPCIACGTTRRIEAMHIGPHGLSQKASDLDVLPGCFDCHHELHRIGPAAFQVKWDLSFPSLIEKLNRFYAGKIKGRAA